MLKGPLKSSKRLAQSFHKKAMSCLNLLPHKGQEMANVENELNDLEDDEKEILESRTPRRVFVTALFHSLFLAACLMTIPAGLTVVLFITSGSAFTSSIVVTIVKSGCDADWNQDSVFNTSDFVAYLNDFNAVMGGGSFTYQDPDIGAPIGVLNTADFVAYLNLFSTGCD